MKSWTEDARNDPLSESEIEELGVALSKLALDGIAIPKHLLRHAKAEKISDYRLLGLTLDAVPIALDRLGLERDKVVVGLIRRFDQAVRDHHEYVTRHVKDESQFRADIQRYVDVVYLLPAAKPQSEAAVTEVANFLRSNKHDLHEKASVMLEGAPYFPVIIDRIFENIARHGIRQWPNRQSRTLASFAHVPEVRLRMMNAFHSQDENLRSLAVMAFSFLKETAGLEVESEVFAIAENDADKLQSSALVSLHKIAPKSSRLRQLALRLIRSDKYWVRGNAIACLEAFNDRESIDALLFALHDEGGHDFDNAGAAAKILQAMPLDPSHALAPLMAILESLLEREDQLYEVQMGSGDIQKLPDTLKFMAAADGQNPGEARILRNAGPEALLNVARILAHLGLTAGPTIPLIRNCMQRRYISGASDLEEWREVLRAIGDTPG